MHTFTFILQYTNQHLQVVWTIHLYSIFIYSNWFSNVTILTFSISYCQQIAIISAERKLASTIFILFIFTSCFNKFKFAIFRRQQISQKQASKHIATIPQISEQFYINMLHVFLVYYLQQIEIFAIPNKARRKLEKGQLPTMHHGKKSTSKPA